MAKSVRIRRKSRVLRSRDNTVITNTPAQRTLEQLYSTPTVRIMRHPQYKKLLGALRRGSSVPFVVNWFDNEGWLGDMSPSTFTQYLYKFKTERSELLEDDVDEKESYDHFVGTSIPEVDEEKEIDKLILIQKRRLSVDIANEISFGKLLDNTHKEIAVMGELLNRKYQMKGGRSAANETSGFDGAALRTLRVNEGEQDRMQSLTTELFKAVKEAHASAKTTKKKAKQRA